MVAEGRRLARLSDAGKHPPFALALIGLHPDQEVDQARHRSATGAVPLNDQQRAVSRNLEGSFPAVLDPPRRPVADRPALVHGLQDSSYEQVVPAET